MHPQNPPTVTRSPARFGRQLRELPAFRGLLRAVEADFYTDLPLPAPVLDLGCGDGHFASVTFDRPLDVGLDPWWGPLQEANARVSTSAHNVYHTVTHADGARMPFPDAHFATVVSNSVLEHIPDVEPVVREVARVLQPGGWFHFCVPGPNFRQFLSVARALDAIRLRGLAEAYRRLFDRISRHHYYNTPEAWHARLSQAGLRVERWWSYFSPAALAALEWGHPLGLPTVLAKKLSGRWLFSPTRWNLALTERLLRRFYEEPIPQEGAYLFFVAQKM